MHDQIPIYLKPLKSLSDRFDRLIQKRLWLRVIIALVLGVITGLLLGPDLNLFSPATVEGITSWLALPGQVFLAVIQMIVVPLVIASIARGLAASSNLQVMKKVGLVAILFITLSTALATSIGIGLGQLVKPGNFVEAGNLVKYQVEASPEKTANQLPRLNELPGKVVALIPKNPLSSMVSGEMLQVILFAAILGVALLSIPQQQSKPLFDLLGALQEVSVRVVSWAMRLAPLAVFGLITQLVAGIGIEVLIGMLMYVLTVLTGLLVLAVFYCLVVLLVNQVSLKAFLAGTRELLLLGFSTSSSAAVMPLTLKVTENELAINPAIARLLIPLGATINMTGTALYQGAATVFLAQVFQVSLDLSSYIFIVTTAVAASIGSPATPGAGIIILSMVLEGVGIPAAGIGLLLGVDRILDMSRTAVNVMGDVVTCVVAQRLVGNVPAQQQIMIEKD